ncbi:hypothetical protein [Rhodopila sp.]|uniref:hypothetical protein n=1 Tax=Rhodopila sp. TaxID=2480087 RepID=UPI003D0FACE2
MDSLKLQDRHYRALGAAARRVGETTDAFRPIDAVDPLNKNNRFLRLHASFFPVEGGSNHPSGYGMVQWQGIFDASYTRPGDYLVQKLRTFFIAAQQPLLPVLCVETNRIISVTRPHVQTTTASNPYGGYTDTGTSVLMEGWPASVLGLTGRGEPAAGLPTDQTIPYLVILVPALHRIFLSPGDLVSDDIGRSAVITGSELTALGWRLSAKMATT